MTSYVGDASIELCLIMCPMRVQIPIPKTIWTALLGSSQVKVILTTWKTIKVSSWEEEAHGNTSGVVVVYEHGEAEIIILARL